MELPHILTIDEAAEYLRVHPMTIRNMIRDGRLDAKRVGTHWRIRREHLEAMLPPLEK